MSDRYPVQSNTLVQHAEMLNDRARNEWFKHRIEQNCPNKVVLDVGAGSGLLTYYALQAGAKHVYAVESDLGISPILRGVLSKCFDSDRYTVINTNFWTDEVEQLIDPDSIDVVISETLGGAGIDEGILTTWWCAKNFAKSDCVFIPNDVSIEVHSWETYDFLGGVPDQAAYLNKHSLPAEFLEAVVTTDTEDLRMYQWRSVDEYMRSIYPRTKLHTVNWSPSNLPEYRFDLEYPTHVFPMIDFTLEIPKGLIAFVPIMEEDYLYNFMHSHWRKAPFYCVPESGTYKVTYKTSDENNVDLQWVIQRLL
jgi:hypothetical protein